MRQQVKDSMNVQTSKSTSTHLVETLCLRLESHCTRLSLQFPDEPCDPQGKVVPLSFLFLLIDLLVIPKGRLSDCWIGNITLALQPKATCFPSFIPLPPHCPFSLILGIPCLPFLYTISSHTVFSTTLSSQTFSSYLLTSSVPSIFLIFLLPSPPPPLPVHFPFHLLSPSFSSLLLYFHLSPCPPIPHLFLIYQHLSFSLSL